MNMNMKEYTIKEYTIDVKEKSLGRAAAEVAGILRGKNNPDFIYNRTPDIRVNIVNISKLKVTGKKLIQKEYKSYSGYPGGLKKKKMKDVIEKKGNGYIFKKAVEGMLPRNKLRKKMIKNLVIKN